MINILSNTFLNLRGQNISMKSPTSYQYYYLLENKYLKKNLMTYIKIWDSL